MCVCLILPEAKEIGWKEWNEWGNFKVMEIAEEENEDCQ
jgi:hypothetical protein